MEAVTADPQKLAVWRLVEDGFNAGLAEVADELCHPGFVNNASILAVPRGPAGLREHIGNARVGIPDIHLHVVGMVSEGDITAVLWQTSGRAVGYFSGTRGHQATSAWLIGFFTFLDGRIIRWDASWEPVRLLVQAGLLEADGGAANRRRQSAALGLIGGLSQLRLDSYSAYPSAADAVRPDAVDQVGRQRAHELLDVVLRAEFLAQHTGIAEALAADAYLSFSDFPDQVGPRGMIARCTAFASAFAPSELAVTTELIGLDHAALRWLVTFEHHGDWAGLAATGRRMPATGSAFVRFRDGKIIQWIEVIDLLSILRQLGGLSDVIPGCYPSQ